MRKTIVFLVIMVMLCSTAYAIYQEPTKNAVLPTRSIIVKTTPITGDIIDPLFRPTSKTEQDGLIIMNGRQQTSARGVVLPDFKPTSIKPYPGRDGKQTQVKKTSIIDPIFQKGIIDPSFKKGSNTIIDPLFKPASGQSTKGIVDPTFKKGSNTIIDPIFIVDPTFKPSSAQTGRKYTRSPTTGRWVEATTGEAVLRTATIKQISTSGNPYTLGGAGVQTTAGQAKDIDALLQERQQKAQQALAARRGY